MKKYGKYKEVGLPWLKEIPEGWGVRELGSVFTERREKVTDRDYQPLSVTKNGIFLQLENVAKTDNGDNRKKVLKDDFVINGRSDRKGSSGLSNYDGSVSLINTVLRIRKGNKFFWNYLLKSVPFQEEFYRNGKGIVADLWSTGYQAMKKISIPIPPLLEQEQIANFLDWKISEIDRLIELEKEHMNTLDELFSTKLNNIFDNITGETLKLRFVFTFGKGLNITKDNLGEQGNKCISYGDVHGKMKFSVDSRNDELKKLSNIENVLISEFALLSKGDFIFADTSEDVLGSGDFTFVENDIDPLYAGYHTVVAKPKIKFDFKFLAYQFESNRWRKQIRKAINGIKVYSITQQILKQSEAILPEIEVQKKIVNNLDDFNSKIKKYKKLSMNKITNLEELKQTLISDAVTGKIDVRNIKIPDFIYGKEEAR